MTVMESVLMVVDGSVGDGDDEGEEGGSDAVSEEVGLLVTVFESV